MYIMSKGMPLTIERLDKYISTDQKTVLPRLHKLHRYARGEHDTIMKKTADAGKPCNRIISPYGEYIVGMITGYFMGEPVKYGTDNKDSEKLLDEIKDCFEYNDEAACNSSLASSASTYGVAYELHYMDADAQHRFRKIPPFGCIPIYDDTLEAELLYFIRYYYEEQDILSSGKILVAEVYSDKDKTTYRKAGQAWNMGGEPEAHAFGLVPVVVYANNEELIGDFETVLSLIDAYDQAQSDTLDDMDYFADAYLVIKGMGGTEDTDFSERRKNRLLSLPVDGDAQWLTKQIDSTGAESLKNRIDEAIHKFSNCPSLTDEQFSQNSSGVAIRYKLFGLETRAAQKEREFRKGLQRRIELVCNIMSVKGKNLSGIQKVFSFLRAGKAKSRYTDISITFSRNFPANLVEMADVIQKIGHLLSRETQIGLLPLDIDPQAEINKMLAEEEAGYKGYEEHSEYEGETE